MEETIYTVEEIAQKLKVKDYTVRGWLRTKQLKGFKMGGRVWRIRERDLEAFFEKDIEE